MKLEVYNKTHFSVFLNKHYLKGIDFNKMVNIEPFIKKIIINLNKYYNLNMNGYYNVFIYVNSLYGIVIELMNIDDEYIKLFNKKIDMKITFNLDSVFLFNSNDYFLLNELKIQKKEIYYYENGFYLNILNKKINNLLMMKLLECTEIIYGDKVYEILEYGKKL
ncbi:MAG: hypothetical protein WDA21_03720 [Bacilli bacterium]